MKRLFVFFLLSLSLTACAGIPSSSGRSCQEGICLTTQVLEPVAIDKPVQVLVTVKTEKDIPGLEIRVAVFNPTIMIEEPHQVEKTSMGTTWKWVQQISDAKAGVPIQLLTTIRFTEEGYFDVIGSAYAHGITTVRDSVNVRITREGGKVYLSGTSIPIPGWTPGEPIPAYTLDPSLLPTYFPSGTPWESSPTPETELQTTFTPQQISPTAPAYPPPATENPPAYFLPGTPTEQPYP